MATHARPPPPRERKPRKAWSDFENQRPHRMLYSGGEKSHPFRSPGFNEWTIVWVVSNPTRARTPLKPAHQQHMLRSGKPKGSRECSWKPGMPLSMTTHTSAIDSLPVSRCKMSTNCTLEAERFLEAETHRQPDDSGMRYYDSILLRRLSLIL